MDWACRASTTLLEVNSMTDWTSSLLGEGLEMTFRRSIRRSEPDIADETGIVKNWVTNQLQGSQKLLDL